MPTNNFITELLEIEDLNVINIEQNSNHVNIYFSL